MDYYRTVDSYYGHKCTVPTGVFDEKFRIYSPTGHTLFLKMWYCIRKSFLIRDLDARTVKFCRNEYVLYMQRKQHSETAPNIIHPLSPFRKWWEVFMIGVSLCILAFYPFASAFVLLPDISYIGSTLYYPRRFFDIFCIMDVIINFQTGFYDEHRELILNRKLIAKNYLKRYFIFDILTCFPPTLPTINFDSLASIEIRIFYIILSILKILRLSSCLHYMKNFAKRMNFPISETRLFLIIAVLIFLMHLISCTSIIIGVLSAKIIFPNPPEEKSWITHDNLWNSSSAELYATALYRTACIMSLSEHDLIVDNTLEDQILVCITWIIAKFSFIVLAAFLVQISRSIGSSESKYKEMLSQLLQYMHHKKLSAYTQNRLISYYEFRFQKNFYKENEIMTTLSGPVKKELLTTKCLNILQDVPFFKGLPKTVMLQIVDALQLQIFLADDIIYKAGSKGSCVYFIVTGTVAIYAKTGQEVLHLYDGEYFGYVGLTSGLQIMTAVAVESCEIYRLDKDYFYKIVEPYPELLRSLECLSLKRIHYLNMCRERFQNFQTDRNKILTFNFSSESVNSYTST